MVPCQVMETINLKNSAIKDYNLLDTYAFDHQTG